MKFRKKAVVIEAAQWFRNGDHPEDYTETHHGLDGGEFRDFSPEVRRVMGWEGDVVRYYRNPADAGERKCENCGRTMHDHGWIDTLEGGHIVCPGDWIITGVKGERYPCKPDIFAASYETEGARPKIVVLCGSSRFVDVMAVCAWLIERDEKAIALGLHLLPHWYDAGLPADHIAEHEGVAAEMDALHLRKIDLADEIFVVNFGDYIGDSTRNEIEYARRAGKPIRWYTHDPIGAEANRRGMAAVARKEQAEA